MFWIFPADSSSADAEVLRYQTQMHSMCITEAGVLYANLGGTAGVALVPKDGIRVYFFAARRLLL